MPIYQTAIIKSKPEFHDEVESVLTGMVKHSKNEKGALQYFLHNGIDDKNLYVFYEVWESEVVLKIHNQQPYILTFFELIKSGKLEENPIVYQTDLM